MNGFRVRAVAVFAVLCCMVGAVLAGDATLYPSQPVRWIVPYPAGDSADVIARTLAEAMGNTLVSQLIVENRPGATTAEAAGLVARGKPDGYTLLTADTNTLAINPVLYRKLPYDAGRDFAHVGMIGRSPLLLVVRPGFPAATVKALVAHGQAYRGPMRFASPGIGSPQHLAMELFMERTGVDMRHVAYKNAAAAVQDLLGDQVDIMFLDLTTAQPHLMAGKLRALAVANPHRLGPLPDVPTFVESGLDGFEACVWQGLVVPAGVPQSTIARLNEALVAALNSADVGKRLAGIGVEPVAGSPSQFADYARVEAARWGKLIHEKNITLD